MTTKAQLRELKVAMFNPLGVVAPPPGANGLRRASWHALMSDMVADGLFKSYVHGGYEITDDGRAAFAAQLKD